MRFVLAVLAACAAIPMGAGSFASGGAPANGSSQLLGFTSASADAERQAERRFAAAISVDALSAIHREVTSRPHLAGTQASLDVADLIRRKLDEVGLETEVHDYQVWLSIPKHVAVALTAPTQVSLTVEEPSSAVDSDSANPSLGPGFVGYSASGTVTAPVLYVNYGLPADYARLRASGLDPKGKVVIARYGHSHRAVKIHTAQDAGAAGIIIYSDPADDGYVRGLTWPNGPWRADFQLQRGNGKYSWFWHGDPLSPGFAATANAPVLDPSSAPTLPRIPAVVLAYKDASKILSRLEGAAVPAAFQGGLPFTYRFGSGASSSVVVKLDVQMDAGRRRIRDVIGTIRGRNPNRWVILATHHDAWTFGGMDPGTGVMAVFETARVLAGMKKNGWMPERSLRFAFWDAEEPGLVGSTEYAEEFEQTLREKAVTYINVDLFMRGHFNGGGTPSLRDFLVEVARDVPAYDGTGTVYDGWRAEQWKRQPVERRRQGQAEFEVDLANLGSGADFVAFQDYLGLPTLSMQYDFEGSYGTYHSNYDTRWYFEHYVDPGFKVTACLTHLFGLTMMRLGRADILPFHYAYYAKKIDEFLDAAAAATIDDNGERLVTIDVANARSSARTVAERALRLESKIEQRLRESSINRDAAAALNDMLAHVEQSLLDQQEPVRENWYRHVVYGWNIYSLYDGQPLPGVADAIRRRDPRAVQQETNRIAAALNRMATALKEAEQR